MSEIANSEGTSAVNEKPVVSNRLPNDVKFPPFPDPTEEEFEEDIGDDERSYYRNRFADLEIVKAMKLHCTACDRHLGSSTKNESRMRAHPMLRTLVCHTCHTFYNSGEFEKGDDGSELYCRWCGQGGQVYCCSDCPHVFCAKCIKRNLGVQKIKEIENTDDWKCFKCNSKCLWDLRAVCWALLRYCDLKNKITYKTEDPSLKEAYQKDCAIDHTYCCKSRNRRKEKVEPIKKKEEKKISATCSAIAKIPSSIQVKKFASINLDESSKDKKAQKRPIINTNDNKMLVIKNPISIAPLITTSPMPPAKKSRMPVVNPVRFAQEKKNVQTYSRIRPKHPTMPIPIISSTFNGFGVNNNFQSYGTIVSNDTLNLSLDSLTQGLDMVAVAAMSSNSQDDDVVCTPDFPLEPLCEVTEDNTDDDVQCITPGPVVPPKIQTQSVSRLDSSLPDLSPDNIVQMTDNDVTVNSVTGGLKFRVDPQTLSSNKMYRLPDGRIFAIKANPNMPGGYSATIVAVTETGQAKGASKGATYAAKLSAVSSSQTSTPPPLVRSSTSNRGSISKRMTPKSSKVTRGTDTSARECDLQVPVEWYRYNLVDAVDALEYSLHRLYKLKKEATCRYLRTRSVEEMKTLHKTLDRLLNTSATRFIEIKDNLNKELKTYILKKTGGAVSDDDDDVEILPDLEDDDPIYIDENSVESNSNDVTCNESQEVDLTGVGSSDQNDSTEIINDNATKSDKNSHNGNDVANTDNASSNNATSDTDIRKGDEDIDTQNDKCIDMKEPSEKPDEQDDDEQENKDTENDKETDNKDDAKDKNYDEKLNDNEMDIDKVDETNSKDDNDVKKENDVDDNESKLLETREPSEKELNGDSEQGTKCKKKMEKELKVEEEKKDELLREDEKNLLSDDIGNQDNDGKIEDAEMSEEMIENLLYEDNAAPTDNMLQNKSLEVVESL